MTLQVYVFGKPQTKEEALEQILTHYKWVESFPILWTRNSVVYGRKLVYIVRFLSF